MAEITKVGRARGLDRAFAILDYLRAHKNPLRPNEIAVGMGAPKSSIYELIRLLLDQNVLEYSDSEGRVFLGRRLHFWGTAYLSHFNLAREVQPYLEKITTETRETSQLCMLDGDKYTVVLMREGLRQFRISADVGERVAIPWTASGRVLLGHFTDAEIEALIPAEDFVLPGGTRLHLETFIEEIRRARDERFFSFDSVADTFTHCFASPIYGEEGHCIATLCIVAPKEDALLNHTQYRETLQQSANELSEKLSGTTLDLASRVTK